MLKGWDSERRAGFVRFAWGQSVLPRSDGEYTRSGVRLLIKSPAAPDTSGGHDGALPRADTCFFNLALPPYSSAGVVARQLGVVVTVDAGLDGDDV